MNQTLYIWLRHSLALFMQKKRPHSSNLLNSPKDLALAHRGKEVWGGFPNEGRKKKERGERKKERERKRKEEKEGEYFKKIL